MAGLVSVRSEGLGGCNISFVIPTGHFSRTENQLVKWGMSFTTDKPKNPSHLPLLEIALCVKHPRNPRQLQPTQISCLQCLPELSCCKHVLYEVQGS